MKLFVIFALAILPITASGSGLENYPGWSMQKIQNESEDGTYDQRVFYSLTPPDGRPAITIDGRSAARIQSGQMSPDDVYGRRAKAAPEESSEGEEFVYSSSNSKIVIADGPSEEKTKVIEEKAEKEVEEKRAPLASALPALPSFNAQPAATQSVSSSSGSSASSTPSASSAVASATSSSSEAESAAPAGTPLRVLPVRPGLPEPKRELAQADKDVKSEKEDDSEDNDDIASGIKSTGSATGFGFKSKEEKEQELKDAKLPLPPCTPGEKVIDKANIIRVAIPKGCNNFFITAWGAGGGNGYSGTRETGGDNSRTIQIPGGSGGGGAFVNGYGTLDSLKYDVVVVVGEGGNNGVAPTRRVVQNGRNNFGGGRDNDNVEYELVGGNDSTGGGRSGVYLIGKANASKSTAPEMALVVAGGGGGGGNYNGGGGENGEGHKGQAGGDHSGGNGSQRGGRGGSSFAKVNQGNIEGGNGPKAGFYYYPDRNKAGDPSHDGKVIFKYF